jgi:hypothetical protein
MVGRLIDRPLPGPIYEVTSYRPDLRAFRQPQEVIRTQPRVTPAAGRRFLAPLIVLIGMQTHSATESGFLSVIRQRPDTTFMGEPTAGSTGQPLAFPLPGNALGVVCSRRSLTPDGREWVGRGFAPDVISRLTREDLFVGRDSTIDCAHADTVAITATACRGLIRSSQVAHDQMAVGTAVQFTTLFASFRHMAINRDTTRAMYITPENSSIMTRARAIGRRGTISPSPTPDSVVKLKKSNSIHVRGWSEPTRAPKLPGKSA